MDETVLASGYATKRGPRFLVILFGVIGGFVLLIGLVTLFQGKDTSSIALAGLGIFGLAIAIYYAARSKFQLEETGSGQLFTIGSTKLGPELSFSACVCEGTTRNTRGRAVGKHPVLQVVLYAPDQTAIVKLTETRNMFQRAPNWEWGEPIDAQNQYGNIWGNIGLEQLVAQLGDEPDLPY